MEQDELKRQFMRLMGVRDGLSADTTSRATSSTTAKLAHVRDLNAANAELLALQTELKKITDANTKQVESIKVVQDMYAQCESDKKVAEKSNGIENDKCADLNTKKEELKLTEMGKITSQQLETLVSNESKILFLQKEVNRLVLQLSVAQSIAQQELFGYPLNTAIKFEKFNSLLRLAMLQPLENPLRYQSLGTIRTFIQAHPLIQNWKADLVPANMRTWFAAQQFEMPRKFTFLLFAMLLNDRFKVQFRQENKKQLANMFLYYATILACEQLDPGRKGNVHQLLADIIINAIYWDSLCNWLIRGASVKTAPTDLKLMMDDMKFDEHIEKKRPLKTDYHMWRHHKAYQFVRAVAIYIPRERGIEKYYFNGSTNPTFFALRYLFFDVELHRQPIATQEVCIQELENGKPTELLQYQKFNQKDDFLVDLEELSQLSAKYECKYHERFKQAVVFYNFNVELDDLSLEHSIYTATLISTVRDFVNIKEKDAQKKEQLRTKFKTVVSFLEDAIKKTAPRALGEREQQIITSLIFAQINEWVSSHFNIEPPGNIYDKRYSDDKFVIIVTPSADRNKVELEFFDWMLTGNLLGGEPRIKYDASIATPWIIDDEKHM